jgi:hypothetical protein
MSAENKTINFLAGWAFLVGAFWLDYFLIRLTGFYYWPTLFLTVYLISLCLYLKEHKLFWPVIIILILPLSLIIDYWSGAPAFGYYATGFLLGSLCFLISLSFTNIQNRSSQLINIGVFLIFFWLIGPLIFTSIIDSTLWGYNFWGGAIHLFIDFGICLIATKLIKSSFGKNV